VESLVSEAQGGERECQCVRGREGGREDTMDKRHGEEKEKKKK